MTKESEASYHDFEWYSLGDWSTLQQGDLFADCPVFVPPTDLTSVLAIQQGERIETAFPIVIRPASVIVLTQSCDLLKDDVTQVLLCSHFPARNYSTNELTQIRKEHRPALHMIEACELSDSHNLGQRVIDFRTVSTLTKAFLLDFMQGQNPRVRLLPPYREHLAQAFARFFMRVGLPRNLKES